jgi:hypothetical protein
MISSTRDSHPLDGLPSAGSGNQGIFSTVGQRRLRRDPSAAERVLRAVSQHMTASVGILKAKP